MLQTLDRMNLTAANDPASAHLKIRQLTKRFGAFTALNAVSLDVLRGELVCFLGPSGCGKTTLLRAIAGLDIQNEGSIELAGRDVSGLPPAERDFGIVFQSYALFPNLSVADNVGYGLVNRKWPRAKRLERVAELLALVGLADQSAKYPVQLSGGQQQRIALARALATSPSLLLLDEPLSALDARVRVRLRDEIKSLQRRLGITTILVTHDQEEALAMADRIVVMNHGVIDQVGTPAEVYGRPRTAFVADFVGTMTFLDGVVTAPGVVRVGRADLMCNGDAGAAAGSKVTLGFRPEEVQVRGLTDATPNRLRSRVAAIEYLGAFCRAKLNVDGVALTADFSANAMRDLGIEAGQTIDIALPPAVLRVFPENREGTS
jgi:iron(III) transport system ATP-binding protein